MSATDEEIRLANEGVYLYCGPLSFVRNLLKLATFKKVKENGAMVLTDQRLVFLKSSGFVKDLLAPVVDQAGQLDHRLARQGGLSWPVTEVQTLSTNSGSVGATSVSDWHFVHQPTRQEYTVRFFDRAAASAFASQLHAPPLPTAPQAPTEAEWKFLGLPVGFGLPAPAGREMEVAYARSVLVIASRQLLAEKPDVARHDLGKLLLVPAYRDNPVHAPFIAVAHYLHALARLKQQDQAGARQDLETCVRMAPQYELARQTLKSLIPPAPPN